jgi:hypothetical protein
VKATGTGSGAVRGGTTVGTVAETGRRTQCEWLRARANNGTHRPDKTVTPRGSSCGHGIPDQVWACWFGVEVRTRPLAQWAKEPSETSTGSLLALVAAVVGGGVKLPWCLRSLGNIRPDGGGDAAS